MKPIVYLLCGLPGSGKTTYAKKLEKKGFTTMQREAIVKNGYADTLERIYDGRIYEKREYFDPESEETVRFLRIKI